MADLRYDARGRALTTTVVIAGACWAVAVTQMHGMDMGVETGLGSFGFFVGVWAAMMAAMMLPGAIPATVHYARRHRQHGAAVMFIAAYVAVWTLFGVVAYELYRPHSTTVAIIITVAAGLYELTPIKRRARQRCQQGAKSGLHYGIDCLGSSIGLMLLLLAWGAMSVPWMSVIAAIVFVQKLVPVKGATT